MKPKLQYIFTWISLAVLLLSGIALMAVSWNGHLNSKSLPSIMILFWFLICASGIFLFMLAVKKAHRSLVQQKLAEKKVKKKELSVSSRKAKDEKVFDFAAVARKLVRRTPDGATLETIGNDWLKNLAREIEIMSGILYIRKGGTYELAASYALASSSEPYSFSDGEGLSGQVAKSKQIRVLTSLPEDYVKVYSGLGKAEPQYVAIVPLVKGKQTLAVLECTGFRYDPTSIESMFRIFSRDVIEKLAIKD